MAKLTEAQQTYLYGLQSLNEGVNYREAKNFAQKLREKIWNKNHSEDEKDIKFDGRKFSSMLPISLLADMGGRDIILKVKDFSLMWESFPELEPETVLDEDTLAEMDEDDIQDFVDSEKMDYMESIVKSGDVDCFLLIARRDNKTVLVPFNNIPIEALKMINKCI